MSLVVLPVVGALLLGGTAYAAYLMTSRSYTADALIAVLPTDPRAEVSVPIAGVWASVGKSEAVLQQAGQALGVDDKELASSLSVTQASNAPIISVRVKTGDPQRSAAWANGVAAQLLANDRSGPVPYYGLKQVAQAVPPVTSGGPLSLLIVAAAVALGALAGLVLDQRIQPGRHRGRRRLTEDR